MKLRLIFTFILIFPLVSLSQEEPKEFTHEVGANIGNLEIYQNAQRFGIPQPLVHWHWHYDLFYRLNYKSSALRLSAFYSNKRKDFDDYTFFSALPLSALTIINDWLVGVGYQYYTNKQTKDFFAFADIYYSELSTTGTFSNVSSSSSLSFEMKGQKYGLRNGIGYRLKLFKVLSICPEVYADLAFTQLKIQFIDPSSNRSPNSVTSRDARFMPAARLLITVAFQ